MGAPEERPCKLQGQQGLPGMGGDLCQALQVTASLVRWSRCSGEGVEAASETSALPGAEVGGAAGRKGTVSLLVRVAGSGKDRCCLPGGGGGEGSWRGRRRGVRV